MPIRLLPVSYRMGICAAVVMLANALAVVAADQGQPDPYVLDPLLQKAHQAYMDREQPAANAIRLFEEYAERNPNSEFLPEVYFRIAALLTMHARDGDPSDRKKAIECFRKAHVLYGTRFDTHHTCAWGSFANMSGSLAEQRLYYDWLRSLMASNTTDDIHPIRHMFATLNGRQARLTQEELAGTHKWMKRCVAENVSVAGMNMVSTASKDCNDLAELAVDYAGTSLGEAAVEKLDLLARDSPDEVRQAMNDAVHIAAAARDDADTQTNGAQPVAEDQERRLIVPPPPRPVAPPQPAPEPGPPAAETRDQESTLAMALLAAIGLLTALQARSRWKRKRAGSRGREGT